MIQPTNAPSKRAITETSSSCYVAGIRAVSGVLHPAREHFYGTYIQGKQGLALWYEWLNLIYSFGGNILDSRHGWEYGDVVINSPQNIAATEQYAKLIAFSPPDTLNYGWSEAQSGSAAGTRIHGSLWSDQAPLLENPAVSKGSPVFEGRGVTDLPATFDTAGFSRRGA